MVSGAVKKVLLPAVGAFAGTLIGNAVDQKPLEYGEAAGGAVLNVVFQFLPTKFLKQKLNKSMSQSIYTWISLFSTCMMNTNSCIISY